MLADLRKKKLYFKPCLNVGLLGYNISIFKIRCSVPSLRGLSVEEEKSDNNMIFGTESISL